MKNHMFNWLYNNDKLDHSESIIPAKLPVISEFNIKSNIQDFEG